MTPPQDRLLRLPVGPWSPIDQQMRFFFAGAEHPFRTLRAAIETGLSADFSILDIGCGRDAPVLRKFVGKARCLYGIDLVPFRVEDPALILRNESVCKMTSIGEGSIDLAYSKSVMEHIEDVKLAYREIYRVLRPGGCYIFLTPNLFDYASIASALVPNRYHPAIVRWLEGRREEDTFPVYYRSNTRGRIAALAEHTGFIIQEFHYLGQYPSYLKFNRALFWFGCVYETTILQLPWLQFLRGWILCILQKETAPEH